MFGPVFRGLNILPFRGYICCSSSCHLHGTFTPSYKITSIPTYTHKSLYQIDNFTFLTIHSLRSIQSNNLGSHQHAYHQVPASLPC